MIGLKRKTVELIEFQDSWKFEFHREKERISKKISNYFETIEHIGSTSIEGIFAKPIIDICIGVKNINLSKKVFPIFEELKYKYIGEYGIPGRHFLRTNSEIVKHHIHILEIESDKYLDHILFRDYLNYNKGDANDYSNFKIKLWQSGISREEYTKQKEKIIYNILRKARSWRDIINFAD